MSLSGDSYTCHSVPLLVLSNANDCHDRIDSDDRCHCFWKVSFLTNLIFGYLLVPFWSLLIKFCYFRHFFLVIFGSFYDPHCLKIPLNVSFDVLNFGIFILTFVLLTLTCQVTLFGHKVFKDSPKIDHFWHLNDFLSTQMQK